VNSGEIPGDSRAKAEWLDMEKVASGLRISHIVLPQHKQLVAVDGWGAM